MKTKKLVGLIVSAISIMFLSAGCDGSNGNSSSVQQSESQNQNLTYSFKNNTLDTSVVITGKALKFVGTNVKSVSATFGKIEKDDSSVNGLTTLNSDNVSYWKYSISAEDLKNKGILFTEYFDIEYTNGDFSRHSALIGLDYTKQDEKIYFPAISYQWYILNNPNADYISLFDTTKGVVKGLDLNVVPAWNLKDKNGQNISGKGVKIAVVDTPIDFEVRELGDNKVNVENSEQFNNPVNTPLTLDILKNSNDTEHGTMVAGIAAGSGSHSGVRGVAYDAGLISVSFFSNEELLAQEGQNDQDESKEDIFKNISNVFEDMIAINADVYNMSVGHSGIIDSNPTIAKYQWELFDKNSVIVKSSDNEFQFDGSDDNGEVFEFAPKYCLNFGTDCTFNQSNQIDRFPYLIITSAIGPNGNHASYSSTGSHLWISGLSDTLSEVDSETDAIITYPRIFTNKPHFDSSLYLPEGDTDENKEKSFTNLGYNTDTYTATMGGTSAATPMITGVVALIKQAKPNVTVPQVRYILANSARNDNDLDTLKYNPTIISSSDNYHPEFVIENGWNTNAAGMRHSNYYGFGLVDAEKAVKLALDCDENPDCQFLNQQPKQFTTTTHDCTENQINIPNTDNYRYEYTCTLGDFKESERVSMNINDMDLNSTLQIDAVSTELSNIVYERADLYEDTERATKSLLDCNSKMQIELVSPRNTLSIIKPLYANWAFANDGLTTESEEDDEDTDAEDSREMNVYTNTFYRETVEPGDNFTLTIRSDCQLDLDSLNHDAELGDNATSVSVWGHLK